MRKSTQLRFKTWDEAHAARTEHRRFILFDASAPGFVLTDAGGVQLLGHRLSCTEGVLTLETAREGMRIVHRHYPEWGVSTLARGQWEWRIEAEGRLPMTLPDRAMHAWVTLTLKS